MARPREFDEEAVLDTAVRCFWSRGYEATTIRDVIECSGVNAASLYNTFGDKRALYQKALDRYVETSIADRLERFETLPPRKAIAAFLGEVLKRSLADRECKGCMVVNAAIEVAPHDAEFQEAVAGVMMRIEAFFLDCVETGQADGSITRAVPPEDLSRHLLGVLMGLRVLARVRPERSLLEGVVASALTLLRPSPNS